MGYIVLEHLAPLEVASEPCWVTLELTPGPSLLQNLFPRLSVLGDGGGGHQHVNAVLDQEIVGDEHEHVNAVLDQETVGDGLE